MERAQLQAQMRNQRPASEFVDDSGARALKVRERLLQLHATATCHFGARDDSSGCGA